MILSVIPPTIKGESRLIQNLGTERMEWPTRESWNVQRSRMSERVTGITGGPRGVRAFEGTNPVVPCRHAGREGIPFLEGRHRKRLREWELVEEGVD